MRLAIQIAVVTVTVSSAVPVAGVRVGKWYMFNLLLCTDTSDLHLVLRRVHLQAYTQCVQSPL